MLISFLKSLFKWKRSSKHPNLSRRSFLGAMAGCAIAVSQLTNPAEAKPVIPITQVVQRQEAAKRSCLFCSKKTIESGRQIARCYDCFRTGLYR